jgi:hypothetical protein
MPATVAAPYISPARHLIGSADESRRMEFTYDMIDLAACQQQGHAPATIIERQANEEWFVANNAVRMDRPIEWSRTAREEHVWIPLAPYLTHPIGQTGEGLHQIFGFMVQLGFQAAVSVGRPVLRVHLSLGYPVDEVVQEGGNLTRVHIGMGVVVGG